MELHSIPRSEQKNIQVNLEHEEIEAIQNCLNTNNDNDLTLIEIHESILKDFIENGMNELVFVATIKSQNSILYNFRMTEKSFIKITKICSCHEVSKRSFMTTAIKTHIKNKGVSQC